MSLFSLYFAYFSSRTLGYVRCTDWIHRQNESRLIKKLTIFDIKTEI